MATATVVTPDDYIIGLYAGIFKRAPDLAGLTFWSNNIKAGNLTLKQTAQAFSNERQWGIDFPATLSNTQFVEKIYQNVLGSAGDSAGISYWTGALNGSISAAAISRTDFVTQFVQAAIDYDPDPTTAQNKALSAAELAAATAKNTILLNKIAAGHYWLKIGDSRTNIPTDPITKQSNNTYTTYLESQVIFAKVSSTAASLADANTETDIYFSGLGADTVAPVFVKATVVADSLVLFYKDASLLNASTAGMSNFEVKVDSTVVPIKQVSIDTSGQTLTLTLNAAVTSSNVVTVSYTDPTSSNDANAIQDVAGNDALSLVAQAVTNNTNAPVAVADYVIKEGQSLSLTVPSGITATGETKSINVSGTSGLGASLVINASAGTNDFSTLSFDQVGTINRAFGGTTDVLTVNADPKLATSLITPLNVGAKINGGAAADTIKAGNSVDVITGGYGADVLSGGRNADTFVFNAIASLAAPAVGDIILIDEAGSKVGASPTSKPDTTTVETITDFVSGEDKIQLKQSFANNINGAGSKVYQIATTTGLLATDFAVVTKFGLPDDTGNIRFYFIQADNILYYDRLGDTVIDSSGNYLAGADNDFAVLKFTGTSTALQASDFVFA